MTILIRVALAVLGTTIVSGASRADTAFGGADAAFVDWAVKNCGLKSTPAEHALVEAATAKGRDVFNRQYMQQFQSPAFAAATADRAKRDHLCRDVKEWYGRGGTRISHLLASDGDPLAPPSSESRPAKSQEGGAKPIGGGRHRGGL